MNNFNVDSYALDGATSLTEFIIILLAAMVLGMLVTWHYERYFPFVSRSQGMSKTLISIALITTLVITVVKSSLALSLGLVIRHAYTLASYQGKGTGSALLEYLLKKNQHSRLLVGTWRNATWAIRFYEKFGFILHAKEQSTLLLKKYWKIPSKQIKNSVVLERF